jgi:S1-C subfamily serine protease
MLLCTLAFPMSIRADSKTTVVKLWVGNSVMSIDGVRQPIDAQGTKPIIVESRTLVPIRAVIESFGGFVAWDADARKVTVILKENTLELWIGQSSASLNGYSLPVDSANPKVFPIIVSGRTMIPLRFVAESLGIDVQYENSTKMITLTYTVETSPPVIQVPMPPVLVSPSAGLALNDSNITFTWLPVTGADSYRLQITKDSSTVHSANNITTTSYSIPSGTLSDGSYSWQVTAHNSAGWGSWSSPFIFSISTPQQLPEAPVLSLPATGSTLNNSEITLAWLPVTGADTYQVQANKDSIVIHSATNITATAYKIPSGTLSDGTYSWQVAAHNSAGWGSWSSPFIFSLRTQMSITDIAKYVDRVVYVEVSGYKDGKQFTASGSGFIISSDGTVVTNYHVIDGATSGKVTLNDGTKYDIVSVLGYAKPKELTDKDLAVIKINASNLPVCNLGDSDKVQVGESVVAIGSPLGLPNVVSNGIVSKIWAEGVIQITAPISHGNSGGPLFNMYGEVIGINTFTFAPLGGENINFALPVNWLNPLDTSLNLTLEQVYQKEHSSTSLVPETPKLVSPIDESVISTITPTLTWTQSSRADYYGVFIYEGLDTIDDSTEIVKSKVYTNSYTVPSGKLVSGKTYTWFVGAYNSYGYNNPAETVVWHLSTATPTLTAPVLLSPDDKESLLEDELSFSWTSVPGAVTYAFWVGLGLSGDPSTEVYRKTVYGTSWTIPEGSLVEGEIYTWAVCAVDSNVNTVWSVDRHFSLIETNSPTLLYPTNYLTIYTNPTMIWFPMYGASSYKLILCEGATFSISNIILSEVVYGTQYTLPAYTLTHGEIYCWYVGAYLGEYLIGISGTYVLTVAP